MRPSLSRGFASIFPISTTAPALRRSCASARQSPPSSSPMAPLAEPLTGGFPCRSVIHPGVPRRGRGIPMANHAQRRLRIGYLGIPDRPGTGAFVYAQALLATMRRRHEVIPMRHGTEALCDLLHLLEPKFLPRSFRIDRICAPLILDLHDHYWQGVSYPCVDRPLRSWAAFQRRRRLSRLLTGASRILVHSPSVAEAVGREGVTCVPYGLPPDPLLVRPRSSPPPSPSQEVLFVGRDALRKGLPLLFEALDRLLREGTPGIEGVHLTVIGREYPHSRLFLRLAAVGLPVTFLGGLSRQEVIEHLRHAALLVLPAHTEAFGIVLLEAMALGVPIVTTRAGGIPDVVVPGESALLVPPGDAAALARAIERVLTSPHLVHRLREGGYRRLERFSWDGMIERIDSLYRETVEWNRSNQRKGQLRLHRPHPPSSRARTRQ
ncbi:MAG: glycosyltransferase family 1 protein [Deltaproteobacteria bacterium]|nr:MAG: glycosyltransferase family 1 protein [Deltaproteobacteria bacterium]